MGYFRKIGWKRFVIMMIGNFFLGVGISIFKFAGLGNDPYSGMVMGISDRINISYVVCLIVANALVFMLELIFGKELIGIGTILNASCLGYITTVFYGLWLHIFALPETLMMKILTMLIGTVITGLGVSLYQIPNVGVSPYDSLSIIMSKKMQKIPYFWYRIFTDVVCAVICFLTGGIVGLGTLVSAFGMGPVINFFNVHFTSKLFGKDENIL